MGSWSVSCGISNIAITSGHKCVLLPLQENQGRYGYFSHIPATLPIFGEYDDYGGIEEIEKNNNTKLIEQHFGVSIEEFCLYLVDGKYTYNRDEAKGVFKKFNKVPELIENMRFMWIDRQVYDHMIVCHDNWQKGLLNFGTPKILKLLGFKQQKDAIPENYDSKRFNQKWVKDGVEVHSDGNSLLSSTNRNNFLYHFGKGTDSSIETYFKVPEELNYLKNLTKWEAWRLLDTPESKEMLGKIFGLRWRLEKNTLLSEYLNKLETYGDFIAQLINIASNLYPMSGQFSPHVLYLTPQCGEYELHQILLDKFSQINKSYCNQE